MRASIAAAALAFAVLVAAVRWGAMIAGGSDSYGYVSQAGLWRQGLPIVQQDLVRESPWPDAAETWAPLGYRPSPHRRDALVPIYAPGLPLAMAAFQAIAGYCAAFLVVPLCGALTVWSTFALGRRLFSSDSVALWGALLVAASPVFLYQAMNAMSDVPATAFCTLALWLAVTGRPLGSGIAMGVAIAIRPNLAPLAGVIGIWLVSARAGALRFAIPVILAIVGIGWLNATLYESPFVSGYGTTSDLYARRYFATNVRQFSDWIECRDADRRRDGLVSARAALVPIADSSGRSSAHRRVDRDRAPFIRVLPTVRHVVVPTLSAADVARHDADDSGGADRDRKAIGGSPRRNSDRDSAGGARRLYGD